MESFSLKPSVFSRKLLAWFDKHGRKKLPWQTMKTPYRVWISEIMLQQTQVQTVIPYFERFMQHFPDISALANASEDEVLHLWTGLGYYQRARNLLKTAKIICAEHKGIFPDNVDDLQMLPGIGRSTAGAISSIAFNKKAPILDGNVKRVLIRLHGIMENPADKIIHNQLWELAERLMPSKHADRYTQAMMDLGATQCIRKKPNCTPCPFTKNCVAHQKGLTEKLPVRALKKSLPKKRAAFLIIRNAKKEVLLEKREQKGVWKGLWSFPEMEQTCSQREIKKYCLNQFGCSISEIKFGNPIDHIFSHYHLNILPIYLTTDLKKLPAKQQIWYKSNLNQVIGMPQPTKFLLETIE